MQSLLMREQSARLSPSACTLPGGVGSYFEIRLHWRRLAWLAIVAFGFLVIAGWHGEARAQGIIRFDQKYIEAIHKSSSIEALGADSFGDNIDLASGSVQFRWTDIDIPGNSALPVRLQRALAVEDKFSTSGSDPIGFGLFGSLDVPYLKGVHRVDGWQVIGADPDARCSAAGPPPPGPPSIDASDYWSGNWMHIPWAGDQMMLRTPAAVLPKPSGGTTIMTKDLWAFKCLPNTKNGYPGEGFIALSPSGEKYYFDYVITKDYPDLSKRYANYAHSTARMSRKMVYFLATRIEDRFGNWVTYQYDDEKLVKISANDGRFIQIDSWDGDKVKTVSSSIGAWSYTYPDNNSMTVTLPDGSHWSAASTGALRVDPTPSLPLYAGGGVPRCPAPELSSGNYTIAITLPSKATATYDFSVQRHAQGNVPRQCNAFIDESLMTYEYLDIPDFNDSLTLLTRSISGPGLPTMQWSYSFGGGVTKILGPDNSYERRIYGNMYKRNAGQLLLLEEGYQGDPDPVVQRTTLNTYVSDGDLDGQPFPDKVGSPGSSRIDDVLQAGLRPLRRSDIVQDGAVFTREITSFDAYARPVAVIKSSAVTTTPGEGGLPPAGIPSVSAPESSTSGSYSVSWSGVSGASSYELRERFEEGAWSVVQSSAALSRNVSGKTSGDWDYAVRACGNGGCSSWSSAVTVAVLPPASSPTLTAPATSYTGTFTVSWTAVTGATTYELRERSNSGAWTTIQTSSAKSRAVSGKSSAAWGYSVRACSNVGCSAWSAAKTITVTLPPTGVPVLTAPATNKTGAYTVSWTAISGATRYELDKKENSGAWANLQNAASTSKAITGQKSGNYGYRVRACNVAGCAGYSSTGSTAVTLPVGVATIAANVPVRVDLPYTASWTAVANATRYELEETVTRHVASVQMIYSGPDLLYKVPMVAPGTLYEFRVRACDVMSCGAYSSKAWFSIPTNGGPSGPGGPPMPDTANSPQGDIQ